MECAFVATWKMPFPGREKLALDLGPEVDAFWAGYVAAGKCSGPEWFFGSDRGMAIVRGDPDTLREICESDGYQRLIAKGNLFLNAYAWDFFKTGDAAAAHVMRYADVGQSLGLI